MLSSVSWSENRQAGQSHVTMTHESSFNIRNPHDFLCEMIIPEHEEFKANNSSARHALLAIVLVHHMYEWVHGTKFCVDHFASAYANEDGMAERFDLARNIANGTKHCQPRASTQVQSGFSPAFSDAFAKPLTVEFPNGRRQSVDSFLREMVEFWKRQERHGAF